MSWYVISVLVFCPVSFICRNSFLPICRVNDFETADILYPSKWASSTIFREPYQRMQLYTTATIACRPFPWPPEFPRALALDFLGPPSFLKPPICFLWRQYSDSYRISLNRILQPGVLCLASLTQHNAFAAHPRSVLINAAEYSVFEYLEFQSGILLYVQTSLLVADQ